MCMLFGLTCFIQEAALTALTLAPEAEHRIRGLCAARQERFAGGIRDIPTLRAMAPEAGMFMLIDVRGTGLSGHGIHRGPERARPAAARRHELGRGLRAPLAAPPAPGARAQRPDREATPPRGGPRQA